MAKFIKRKSRDILQKAESRQPDQALSAPDSQASGFLLPLLND
jgi:hypothetical protein